MKQLEFDFMGNKFGLDPKSKILEKSDQNCGS